MTGRIIIDVNEGFRKRGKYPLESLAVGDEFYLINAPRTVRGCLYNRAEALEIRITINRVGDGSFCIRRAA